MAGSEVAITVESMFSMNSATATISGTTRSFSFGGMGGAIGFSVGRLFAAVADRRPAAGISGRACAIGVTERFRAFAGKIMRPGAVVIGERGFRRQRDGKRVVGDGSGEVEPFALGIAAVDVGVGQTRIEFYRLIEIGERAVKLALCGPGAAAIVVGRGRRIELDRLVVVGNGAVGIAFVAPGNAAIVVRGGIAGVDAQRRSVVGDGAAGIALVVIGIAAIVVGDGELRIKPDRRVVVGDGAVEIALLIIGIAALVEGSGQARIETHRLAQIGDGAIEIAAPAQGEAAIVADIGIVRIEANGPVVVGQR